LIIAPEVLCRQNHNFAVDFYALGVIAYELMMKKIPYKKNSREQMKEDILGKPFIIRKSEIPEGWSCGAADFITKVSNATLKISV
jgi:serine/threonine protein kinase